MQPINQQLIKITNLKRIYQIVSRQKMISRVRLSQMTKLSKTTVSALVDELIANQYLSDLGVGSSEKIGRKPNALQLNSEYNFVAAFSVHRDYLRVALVNIEGQVCYCETIAVSNGDCVEHCRKALDEILIPHLGKGRLLGVCMIFPAMIDYKNCNMISTVLDKTQTDNIIQRLRQVIPGYPLAIFNDTACYAYAELIRSKLQESTFAFINVNKGVGAILLHQGQMFRGANGMTTQFGHFSIDRNGPVCSCGNKGCLEQMIGETMLERRAKEAGLMIPLLPNEKLSFQTVGKLAAAGRPEAVQLVDLLAKDLSYAISNLISMFHPQLIVIGGTGVNLGEVFLKSLYAHMQGIGFPGFMSDVVVQFSELTPSSELQGAVTYYMDKHFSFDGEMDNKLFLQ